jgi:hypothetical protein
MAAASQVRFHFVPVDACGTMSFKPSGPSAGVGERVRWFGTVREPCYQQPRPTHIVTFWHPYTGRTVKLPITFPEGTPRVEHARDRIIFNYGSYTVEAHFYADGSADVVYNSGFLRAI